MTAAASVATVGTRRLGLSRAAAYTAPAFSATTPRSPCCTGSEPDASPAEGVCGARPTHSYCDRILDAKGQPDVLCVEIWPVGNYRPMIAAAWRRPMHPFLRIRTTVARALRSSCPCELPRSPSACFLPLCGEASAPGAERYAPDFQLRRWSALSRSPKRTQIFSWQVPTATSSRNSSMSGSTPKDTRECGLPDGRHGGAKSLLTSR